MFQCAILGKYEGLGVRLGQGHTVIQPNSTHENWPHPQLFNVFACNIIKLGDLD